MPGWLLLIHDVILIICWELLRSGSRAVKETEVEQNDSTVH